MTQLLDRTLFHNIPHIISTMRTRLNNPSKLLSRCSPDKVRLDIQHLLMSLLNNLNLLDEEVCLLIRKNQDLEQKERQLQTLYHQYQDKYFSLHKQSQKHIAQLNQRNNKLQKQNEYLNFVNKGLRDELEEKKRYIGQYKHTNATSLKNMMKTVEIEVRNGAQKVVQKLGKVMQYCDVDHEPDGLLDVSHIPKREHEFPKTSQRNKPTSEGDSQHFLERFGEEQFQLGPGKSNKNIQADWISTVKKRSTSCQSSGKQQPRKTKIENKLARIVFQQAKLTDKNEKYRDNYL